MTKITVMATCKNCGKPLIPYGGKCVYCRADVNEQSSNAEPTTAVDLVFCIDCSSSMASVIDSIKGNVFSFIKGIEDAVERIDWRAKIAEYFEIFAIDKLVVLDEPFVTTPNAMKSQLDGIKVKEVYVNKESPVVDMVSAVLNTTKWREKCQKYIMLFTDKMAKETHGKDLDLLAQELMEKQVVLLLWGKRDSFYDKMMKIPYSAIVQFDDPIAYYCNDNVDFGQFMARLGPHT